MKNSNLLPRDGDLQRMRGSLVDRIDRIEHHRTRIHRLVGAAAVIGILATGTGAALAVTRAPQGEINYTAVCYGSDSTHGPSVTSLYLPGDLSSSAKTPIDKRVALAESMCAATWRIGAFQAHPPARPGANDTPNPSDYPVPGLATCQLADGRLAVFPVTGRPETGFCDALGLTLPSE